MFISEEIMVIEILINRGATWQSQLPELCRFNRCGIIFPRFQLRCIRRLDQPPEAAALIVLIRCSACCGRALDPCVCLIRFWIIGQGVAYGKVIARLDSCRIGIAVVPVVVQMLGIVRNGAGLPPLVLGPGILRRVSDGDDALPLVVQNVAHVHIESGVVRHEDIRRAIRCQNLAVAGAGDLARQIDLAARRVDIFHEQLFRGGIPIDLRHIVKDLLRIVPLRAAFVDPVHGAVLHDGRTIGGSRLCRSQLSLRHRGSVGLVAALDQAVHIDIGGGHIDFPPGNIARSHMRIVSALTICFTSLPGSCSELATLIDFINGIFQALRLCCVILLRVSVDVDNAILVILGNRAVGGDELDRCPRYTCGTILRAAVNTDISAGIVDGHIAIGIADLSVHLDIGEGCIFQLSVPYILLILRLFSSRQVAVVNFLLQLRVQRNNTRLSSAESFCILYFQPCRRAVGYAINPGKSCAAPADIDIVDLLVSLGQIRRRNDVINIIDNLSALFSHKDIVQLQIGVGLIFN